MTDASVRERLARLSPEQRAQLARQVRERAAAGRREANRTTAGAIPRLDRSSGRLPMSSSARRLYFLQKLQPESPAYNNVEAVRIRGRVDLDALRRAFAAVVERHEILRTRCEPGDGEPVLVLVEDPRLELELVDVPPGADVREVLARYAARPFDLDNEVPIRLTLARLGAEDHALLFVAHHLASDAWSCRLLVREFFAAYAAGCGGGGEGGAGTDGGGGAAAGDGNTAAEALAIQYADFAAWQSAQSRDADLRYWRERLAGMPPVLELPRERPRPPVRDDQGAELQFDLPGDLRERLRAAARDASVTPYALLLTAFGYVLHRHCATDDVVVGMPVSGRDRVEVEGLVGCFINTVVLRLELSDAPSRRELVRRVWERTLDDFDHQRLPFDRLVAELNPERDLSVGQLVQVMFNHYPATELASPPPGLVVEPLHVPRSTAKFDLTCTVVDTSDVTRVSVNYATGVVEPELARRLGEHFVAVLDALVTEPDAPVGTLPSVPPDELAAPADPPVDNAGELPLRRFEGHAAAHPDRTAARCGADVATYRELNARANRLARWLAGQDLETVALLFDRSVDHLVAMLAAMKAGVTYLPLDPTMPAGHLATVLAEADAGLVLTHAAVEVAPAGAVRLEDLDLDGYDPADLNLPIDSDQPMYVLFTSGSTGRPKGVVVEHGHVARYLTSLRDRMALPDGLHFAIVSTLAADLGLTNLFGALTTGGTLHVLDVDTATDPELFAGYFRQHRIDVMKLVPSHLAAVAEAGLLADVVPRRALVLAGEACRWDLVEAVRAVRPDCEVWNHYGPTETTVSVLAYRVPEALPQVRGATVPLGVPFDHVRVRVVDPRLRPVPRGAAGELLISGGSVARYLSTVDSGRFVPDGPGRAYRSGDRVRVRADGTIEFLGRLDRQTKIRGYRVEPSYVEAVLRRHPVVTEVAVAVRHDNHGRAALVAYLTGAGGSGVREFARAELPPYLVPSAFVPVDRIPLTPNGKIDWSALPDPAEVDRQDAVTPPRHAADAEMVRLWCEVLGLDSPNSPDGPGSLGIDDDFFDAGGDSFAAMRLARRIGGGLRVVSVFQHPTVRRLVDHLDAAGGDRGEQTSLLRRMSPASTVEATATIVAVPYGGATSLAYRELAAALPPDFPLYAVELPGHDVTAPDEPLLSFDELASRCTEEITRTISGPIVLYGHCVGAALGYEIAQRLADAGAEVTGMVAGGAFPAPRLPGRLFDLWAKVMPSDRWRADRLYRDMLRAVGGLADELDPAEQKTILRALRHDARESEDLYSRRCHDPDHQRTVPALCVVGERDRITEFHAERYREWNLLCARTELAVIPDAGHYFGKHQPDQLAAIITGWVADRAAAPLTEPAPGWAAGLSTTAPGTAAPGLVAATIAPPRRDLRGFALVTLGQLVSLVGSRALAFALGIWVYLQTGSVTQFSVILVTALLPGLLALPFAGAAADRWNRRLLMVAGEIANAAGTTFCLVAFATGSLQVWHVYVAASLGSIGVAFQQPAYLASVAQLVPKQYLGRTNGVLQVVVSVSQAVGPLLGGTLIVLIGLGGVMVVDLTTVAVALVTLAVVRIPDLLFRRREESIWKEISGGLRYIARRRPMVAMIVFFLGYNLVLGFALALLPPMVLSFASAGTLSLATMVGAVGGITGGVAMALWGGFARRATGMVGFAVLTGLGMIVAAARPSPLLPIVGLAAMMASIALINGHWQTMIQVKVGMELQGRILATNRMIANLTEPLGYLGAGWLADSLFEPAMAPGGALHSVLGGVLGSGPGRGMAVLVVLLGAVHIALAVTGLRWRTLRYMEDALPDAVPGAIVTWDRDALQEQADTSLRPAPVVPVPAR